MIIIIIILSGVFNTTSVCTPMMSVIIIIVDITMILTQDVVSVKYIWLYIHIIITKQK